MKRPAIKSETNEIGCGPVNLNVDLARRFGWSEKALNRAWANLAKISRREASLSHRNGPVKGCPCITCDLRVKEKDMPEEYRVQRVKWRVRGLI